MFSALWNIILQLYAVLALLPFVSFFFILGYCVCCQKGAEKSHPNCNGCHYAPACRHRIVRNRQCLPEFYRRDLDRYSHFFADGRVDRKCTEPHTWAGRCAPTPASGLADRFFYIGCRLHIARPDWNHQIFFPRVTQDRLKQNKRDNQAVLSQPRL